MQLHEVIRSYMNLNAKSEIKLGKVLLKKEKSIQK